MKIGIVTTWFERGAAVVSKQFKNILENEHEVVIYARGGESYAIGDPNWDGDFVTWGEKPKTHAFTDINIDDFRRWLIDNEIELVLFNEQKIWAPVLLCKELNIKTGAYIDYYTEETIPLFEIYDFLICNTRKHLSAFANHSQAFFIPWGTDTELYRPKPAQDIVERQITFFHSAGMSPYRKGTDMLLLAFYDLREKAKLLIHSQVSLREKFPHLVNIIDELEAEGSLTLYEKTLTAPGLYYKGDVYVYPSRLEGIGLTILEAVASGLPIIVPDYGPMNEFVTKDTGVTVKVSKLWSRWDGYYWPQCEVDIDDLRLKMSAYVDNVENITSYKKTARKYAESHFDWNKNTKNLASTLVDAESKSLEGISDIVSKAQAYDKKYFLRHQKTNKQLFLESFSQKYPKLFVCIQRIKNSFG